MRGLWSLRGEGFCPCVYAGVVRREWEGGGGGLDEAGLEECERVAMW